MRFVTLITMLLGFTNHAWSADPPEAAADPIPDQVRACEQEYLEAESTAKRALCKAIDMVYEHVKADKKMNLDDQLAALEKLQAQKKFFVAEDVLPSDSGLKAAVLDYKAAMKKAMDKAMPEFEKAANTYRDQGKLDRAALVLDEMKKAFAKADANISGNVYLYSRLSGKVICPEANQSGSRVMTAEYIKDELAQQWKMVDAKEGWIYIEHPKSGMVMTVSGTGNGTGADIVIKPKQADSEAQLWKLVEVKDSKDVFMVSSRGSGKVLGVAARALGNGVRIILWPVAVEGATSQHFATSPLK